MKRAEAFHLLLAHFSVEKLPITFSDENVSYFSNKNKPLPEGLIKKFIQQREKEGDHDELTEYIACCKIPDSGDIHAIVYWRGKLMAYDYILATFDQNGVLISKKVIAGIRSEGSNVKRSVATIDKDKIIDILAGEQKEEDKVYDPSNSRAFSMELLTGGEIIFSLQNE